MRFRLMAEEMTEAEIRTCMGILVEDSIIKTIKRDVADNAIYVTYTVIGDKPQKEYTINLGATDTEGLEQSGRARVDAEWIYTQFLVARGYSDYWRANFWAE